MVTFCPAVLHKYSLIFSFLLRLSVFSLLMSAIGFFFLLGPIYSLFAVSFKAVFPFSFMCHDTLVQTICTSILPFPATFPLIFTSSTDRFVQSSTHFVFLSFLFIFFISYLYLQYFFVTFLIVDSFFYSFSLF